MSSVSLRDIEDLARIESAKLKHFYVGVEHLFIALTKLDSGLTVALLDSNGHSARYLRYALREFVDHGDDRRYWPGYRLSPRAEKVLKAAQELINNGTQPDERALLLAILDEGKSIPVRLLSDEKVDTGALRDEAMRWEGEGQGQAPLVPIDGGEDLPEEVRIVLQQMFQKYDVIQVEHVFSEGFSGSIVLLIRPLQADGRSDQPVVVKIAERQTILWEKKRYDSYVRDTLPPTTARIETEPVLPETTPLGGIKYTFVRMPGGDLPSSLSDYAASHASDELATFLREALYNGFREAWWGQARPYRFSAWQEYEYLLPPALIVQSEADAANAKVLRPLEEWSRTGQLSPGELVELDAFTVQKVKRTQGTMQLAAGAGPESINRSSQVEVRGLDLSHKGHFRGEVIRKLTARVVHTRDDLLQQQVQSLEPNFKILDPYLPYSAPGAERLPNPLRHYGAVLDMRVSGTLATIHGDLYLNNILIGPGGEAWLIDFEATRDGHTLFDWAMLEISLLIEHVMLSVGQTWEDVWQALKLVDQLNRQPGQLELPQSASQPAPLAFSIRPIVETRRIVKELLATPESWTEYQIALAFCALRVIGWSNRSLTARRLAFLASALAMYTAQRSKDTGFQGTEITTERS